MAETKDFSAGPKPKGGEILNFPLLPLRDIVIFPGMIVPLFIGRTKSIKALEEAMVADRRIVVVAQHEAGTEEPTSDDLYTTGCIAEVLNMVKLPDGTIKVLIEGSTRVKILEYLLTDAYFVVRVEAIEDKPVSNVRIEALMRDVLAKFDRYVRLTRTLPPEAYTSASSVEDPCRLADLIASQLVLKVSEKQQILEATEAVKRLEALGGLLDHELEIIDIQKKIQTQVKKQIEQTQKEYYLKEQLKAIHKELGEDDEKSEEMEEIRRRMKEAKLPDYAEEKVEAELKRLQKMPFGTAEAVVVRNYIDWLLSLPWAKRSKENLKLDAVKKVLDEDHYGLEKVKERVVEYLAVRILKEGKGRGTILCFVGPPGVGKTSMGKSIARALNRTYVRASLGGVRDEAEIRGHRRTYVGSLPGRVIQAMKKAKTINPVFLLDEVDKMSTDFRGDPSAALLEVLDPEMNHEFSDHYLEIHYNLSDVMFITTANLTHPIPPPLLDRMEVLHLPGYTENEKLHIAKKFLIPKQVEENGLKGVEFSMTDSAIREIVRRYTREAGVRNLERTIATICRKHATQIVKEKKNNKKKKPAAKVTVKNLEKYLSYPKFRFGQIREKDEAGVATGLAWTSTGGEVLAIEINLMKGKGNLQLTGQLGDVMKESAHAALSYTRSNYQKFKLKADFYKSLDIHIHVPEGGVPKDGPSAGAAIASALVSALTGMPVRRDVAMTGEITLRGKVLPVGGVKEKTLAASRAGIENILLPDENEKDFLEIPQRVRGKLKVRFVKTLDDVLDFALIPGRSSRGAKKGGKKKK